jgi:hypothetical protein
MSLGSLVYRFRTKFQHGMRVAYWRDVVRPRILQTRPVASTTDKACEIHVMTSKVDWLNLIWALKSFYWASGRHYGLCIHDDGSLEANQIEVLRSHFPGARIIERRGADERMRSVLAAYPRSLQFRLTNHLAPKVFDFATYLEVERMLLLDSDVLFFAEPTALVNAIENPEYTCNLFNADDESSYTVESDPVRQSFNFELRPLVNSGLAIIHRGSLRCDWIEEFLQLPGILDGHFWRIEQTVYALCSSRFGVELLPEEYRVRLGKGFGTSPCRHYVGPIRHLMYGEGMRHLVNRGMLKDLA